MTVLDMAIPIFPREKAIKNNPQLVIVNDLNRIVNNIVITVFIRNTRITLKISLPLNIVVGAAINCKVNVVPRSSSDTNALDNPDIAEKKITTHNNPPVKYSEIFSWPIEKRITLIVTRINIAKALIA